MQFATPEILNWLWAVILCALLLRLFHLSTLLSWPRVDEGQVGFTAIHLARQWSWDVFYLHSQSPGLFFWAMWPIAISWMSWAAAA